MRITNKMLYALLCDMQVELEVLREKIDELKVKKPRVVDLDAPAKTRGRPKGSKNKAK